MFTALIDVRLNASAPLPRCPWWSRARRRA